MSGSFFGPPSLVHLLRHRAMHQADDLAYIFLADGEAEEIRLTYAELDRRARAIAVLLLEQDLEGERALLLYPPGLDFIEAFFGCLYAGIIAVPAYPPRLNRSLNRIQSIADDAEAAVALTTCAVLRRVQPLLEQTPELKHLGWRATDEVTTDAAQQWTAPSISHDTLAFLQYTSGSTGTPKGVALSHGNLLHNLALIAYGFEHTRSGKGVFWLPSYHDMGLVGGVLQPLYVARPNVLMSPMSFLQKPLRWLQAITRFRGTTSGGPNFAYDLCVRKIPPGKREGLDLSSWSVAFNGAEPIRDETLDRFVEAFEPYGFRREAFYPCYGLAEGTLIVSGGEKAAPPFRMRVDPHSLENGRVVKAAASQPSRRLISSGRCLPDQEVRIVGPQTKLPCPEGHVGEIWVRGPSIARGYWKRTEENERMFRAKLADSGEGSFLRTGDLGFLQSGELFVTGRIKDVIIINGLNHYPHDIELTVEKSHEALRAGCGAAFTHEQGEQSRLVVVHELERRFHGDFAEVFQAIRRDVSENHDLAVQTIVLVRHGTIPKTSSGKIQRHASRQAFLDDTLDQLGRWSDDGTAASSRPLATSDHMRRREPPAPAVKRPATPFVLPQNGGDTSKPISRLVNNGSDRPTSKTTVSAEEVVFDAVRRVAGERAGELSAETNVVELGLSSLERFEIGNHVEDRFGGQLPLEILNEVETIGALVDAVKVHLGDVASVPTLGQRDDIPAEHYRFEQYPEYVKLRQDLNLLESSGLGNPYFNVHEQVTNDTTVIGGRKMINFSSYNYVGMSGDPRVSDAAKEAIDRFGTSVSASRLVSGEKTLHRELERAIADFVGAEDAITFVGGHSTNETTLGHLFGEGDLVIHDALAHNSILQGALLSGARRRTFPHNDYQALDELLADVRHNFRRVLIAIEGVYSMDGDIPDLPQFIDVKTRHKAFLFVDEAHSIGVLGPHGRGIGEHFDVDSRDVDLWMGTLSKAFGSCGGYIAGGTAVVEYLKYTAPGFVYSVGLSPANTAAALASLRLLESEPERVSQLHERAGFFLQRARAKGLNTGMSHDSPVVPIILGNSPHALALSQALNRRGINVQPILYPAVEESLARLRFFITSTHTQEQLAYTVDCVADELKKIAPTYLRSNGAGSVTESLAAGRE